ncbi:hypothetical protein [Rubrivirga sp.]|uniref:hypothetical protein n=1 Tax=Rubrivirga sp. TaxID=1885344 RepID=UPI003C720592
MPDRFSEEEARRIFARAAERQHADASRPEGLSMAELEEIAQASGIDPAHVAAAVADVRGGLEDVEPVHVWGINLQPRRSRVVPGELTDAAWAEVVARLRRTFGSKGIPTEVGPVREWSSGADSNLLVTATPVEGGTRVTLESSRAHEFKGSEWGLGALGAFLAVFVGIGLANGELYVPAVLGLVSAVVFAVAYGISRVTYSSWSTKRLGQFDALLDQIELVARADAGSRPTASTEQLLDADTEPTSRTAAPLLDLDALEAEPGTGEKRPRGRDRA